MKGGKDEKNYIHHNGGFVCFVFDTSLVCVEYINIWYVFFVWVYKKEEKVKKMEKSKRKQLVSLLSMMTLALGFFLVFGIAVNWNLLIILACFIPILLIGVVVIFLPEKFKEEHEKLSKKIDKKITDVGKTLSD